jgi:hypothetical protein
MVVMWMKSSGGVDDSPVPVAYIEDKQEVDKLYPFPTSNCRQSAGTFDASSSGRLIIIKEPLQFKPRSLLNMYHAIRKMN